MPAVLTTITCLALNIYHEARGEPVEGQIAVAQVTLNRVDSPRYPDDVCAVVFDDGQFTWTAAQAEVHEHLEFSLASLIAELSLQGEFPDLVYGATHYYNPDKANPYWAEVLQPIGKIGNHVFMLEE